jgi:preprotein translocase subunit SecA
MDWGGERVSAILKMTTMQHIFETKSPVDKKTLNRILEETIAKRLEKKNFKWDKNFLWFTDYKNSIRQILKYVKLKGEQGTFAWGGCLDFVPTITGNKVKYHRTDKNVTLQLFEWTDEYAQSFFGGQLDNGITTHWGEIEAKESILKLFNKYENKIFDWFEKSNTLENLMSIATRQIEADKSYKFHSPNPKFVLAFLFAKIGELENAISTFEQLSDYINNEKFKIIIRKELEKVANNK